MHGSGQDFFGLKHSDDTSHGTKFMEYHRTFRRRQKCSLAKSTKMRPGYCLPHVKDIGIVLSDSAFRILDRLKL